MEVLEGFENQLVETANKHNRKWVGENEKINGL